MAKRKPAKTQTQTKIIRMSTPPAKAPIINVRSGPIAKRKAPRRGKGRRKGSGGTTLNTKTLVGVAVGGAIIGWVEKNYGSKLPAIPVVGVKGSVAIAAWFLNQQGIAREIMRDICIAATGAAAYQLGLQSKISGEGLDGDIVPQVGIAAQV